jgi:hypothetical protein
VACTIEHQQLTGTRRTKGNEDIVDTEFENEKKRETHDTSKINRKVVDKYEIVNSSRRKAKFVYKTVNLRISNYMSDNKSKVDQELNKK